MKRLGTCLKCGQLKTVRDHHINGYIGEHKDEVVPYCQSCDRKAHNQARKSGRCNTPTHITHRLSKNSYHRRAMKVISFRETVAPNVRLHETVIYNTWSGHINYSSCFEGNNERTLLFVDI